VEQLPSHRRPYRCPSFLSTDWVLAQFSAARKRAQKLYARFIRKGVTRESPWKDLKGQIFLGDRTFIDSLGSSLQDGVKEIPRSHAMPADRSLKRSLLPNLARTEQKETKISPRQ
jgi:hypothetical protein